jgi:hypothetical protein
VQRRRRQVEIATEGEFDLAKNAPDVFNPGDVAKVAARSNIIAAAGTLGVGWVVAAAAAGAGEAHAFRGQPADAAGEPSARRAARKKRVSTVHDNVHDVDICIHLFRFRRLFYQ